MSDSIKTTYRAEYRTKISRSDNAKLLKLKKFSDYNEAMNYYSEQLNNLESAEEYETMRYAFKMLDSVRVNSRMEDKPVLDVLEKELIENEILRKEIKCLQAFTPDVFFFANGLGYVQAWKGNAHFWVECKGVNGEYFIHKFHGYDMVNTCETYFSALRMGYPLWEV